MGVLPASAFGSWAGVSSRSGSSSSSNDSGFEKARRLDVGVVPGKNSSVFRRVMKPLGGEGVLMGAEDGAEVPEEAEGTRKRAGEVKLPNDPRDRS